MNLANSKSTHLLTPEETVDGKKIIYKAGKEYIDPKNIQTSVDGSLRLKADSNRRTHEKKGP